MKGSVRVLFPGSGRWIGASLTLVTTIFLSVVVTSSAVPAPGMARKIILDHFECYAIQTDRAFESRAVVLRDQFGVRKGKVVAPEGLCNPVQKNNVQIRRRDAHLFCYRISMPRMPSRDVEARNQFGLLKLRAVIPYSLCLPSGKSETDQPAPIPERFDHYECYRVKPLAAYKRPTVTLADQFSQFKKTKAAVVSVFTLCNPVSKNKGTIVNKNDHLVCYTIKTRGLEAQKVVVHNQYEAARVVEAARARLLCVPSLKREIPPQPDLTVNIVPKLTNATIPVSCPTGAGSCKTTAQWRITNLAAVAVTTTFQVKISADPAMSVTKSFTSFPASGSQTFTEVFGPGGNCYDPDCTVSASVDIASTVAESNEANNSDTYTVPG